MFHLFFIEETIKPFVCIELCTVKTVGWILSPLIPVHKEGSWLMRDLTCPKVCANQLYPN